MTGRNTGEADDSIQGCANIVAHVGQKGGLGATGMLRLRQRIVQQLLLLHFVEHIIVRITHGEYSCKIVFIPVHAQNAPFAIAVISAFGHGLATHTDDEGGLIL